jgi:hypothetical protein
MALTDTAIRKAKPEAREYKMADGAGLYLLVTPAGGKLWRLKFRIDGREKKLSIGSYPEISLADARRRRDEARELIALGKDPAREKQQAKHRAQVAAGDTFAEIGREYLDKRIREGMAKATTIKNEYHLTCLAPALGACPSPQLAPPTCWPCCACLKTGQSTKRPIACCNWPAGYSAMPWPPAGWHPIPRAICAARFPPQGKHFSAILEPVRVGELLRAIDAYESMGIVRCPAIRAPCLRAAGRTAPRAMGRIRFRQCRLDDPAEKTKMRKEHHVPLSRQMLAILQDLRTLTGPSGHVFPSVRTRLRPMSENTMNAGLRRGFGAMK